MTIALSPERAHRELLADLERRAQRAIEIAETAATPDKERRAMERYFLRLLQYEYASTRPLMAWCMQCEPERAMRLQGSFDDQEQYCLEHFTPVLERWAKERTEDLYAPVERVQQAGPAPRSRNEEAAVKPGPKPRRGEMGRKVREALAEENGHHRLPEQLQYVDDGCDLAPKCLECPLPLCRYDLPPKRAGMLLREAKLRRLLAEGLTIDAAAERMGVSRRTVFRLKQYCYAT